MLLTRTELQILTKEALFKFLLLKMPEGPQIDYKENIPGANKSETYREFLKDVTAFANAHGGMLLLGVKEPEESSLPESQCLGIPDGENVAKNLERLAATSIDPRIPGLLIKPVLIKNCDYVIIAYVPPSLMRPHMFHHEKHQYFYVRHSESSVPMSAHEIRDVVLSSATSEQRARNYALEEENEAIEYIIKDNPAFLIQAMPILTLEDSWDVLGQSIDQIVRGQARYNKYGDFSLESHIKPTPTLKGVKGRETREGKGWLTEIHRTGFIQAIYMDIQQPNQDENKFVLHGGYSDLFKAFCEICESLWKATETDVPYLLRLKYFNAENTVFYQHTHSTGKYGRRVIAWPEQIRQVGEPLEPIHHAWTVQLFNAFGLNWKPS
jgi:hypothetical protein